MSLNNTIQIQNSNLSKAQQNVGKKALADSAQAAGNTDFQHLFANALSARATPDAKFSTIQEELHEALGKNKKSASDNEFSSPTTDPYGMAGAGSLAQANIWAQRNWSENQSGGEPEQQNTLEVSKAEGPRAEATGVDGEDPSADKPDEATKTSQNSAEASSTQAKATEGGGEPKADPAQTGDATRPGAQAAAGSEANRTPTAPSAEDLAARLELPGEHSRSEGGTPQLKTEGALRTADTGNMAANATQAMNTNNAASAAQRPEQGLSLAQQALQGQQQMSGASASGRSLKAGDEILATAGTSASSGSAGNAATPAPAGTGLASMATGRTGLAAEATIKTPVNQPGFVKELGAQVQWAVGKNLSTVDIRLNPTDMGGMNLRIVQRGQDIQLMIRTQDESAGALMNQHIAGLKETLAQSGLNLTQVQVQSSPNTAAGNPNAFDQQGQQAQAQSGNGSGSQGQGGQQSGQPKAQHTAQTAAPDSEAPRRARNNGNIDLIA